MRNRLIGVTAACCALAACGGDDRAETSDQARTREGAASPTATPPSSTPARRAPRVTTLATGLEVPWEIAFLPDGRALVTERPGRVRLVSRRGELRTEPVATVEVQAVGEGGLLGLAVDPDFDSNRFVYLFRTVASGNEVARYEMTDDSLQERAVIARGIRASGIHNGGRLRFGPDERLYFSAGDAADEDSAQDPDGLNGKILRLGPDAYRRGSDTRPEVFSLGHRNPQGFDWQPGTGRFVENEHGPDGDDEVNLLRRGGNYGWPVIRGEERGDGLQTPVAVYPQSIAPSGSTFVRRSGSAWTGDYLMAGLVGQRIQRVTISRAGRVTGNEALLEGDYGRMRSIVEGPDGALYALTNNTDGRGSPQDGDDRILRIVPPAL